MAENDVAKQITPQEVYINSINTARQKGTPWSSTAGLIAFSVDMNTLTGKLTARNLTVAEYNL
jgi:hypothetical protein